MLIDQVDPHVAKSVSAGEEAIHLSGVTVKFTTERGTVTALNEIDLSVRTGAFLTLLGPSGCGKSTLLRILADLVPVSEGVVRVMGGSPADARKSRSLGFVFQDTALMPWRTALENIRLPLEVRRGAEAIRGNDPRELLALVGLSGWENAYPHELSGGMRQRVAIARALVTTPRLLLMDEPFGALDEVTRDRLNEELLLIWERTGTTILFVTHSIYEAVFLGEKVLVLAAHPGRVKEVVPVSLPSPRRIKMRETAPFMQLAAILRSMLEN